MLNNLLNFIEEYGELIFLVLFYIKIEPTSDMLSRFKLDMYLKSEKYDYEEQKSLEHDFQTAKSVLAEYDYHW